MFGRTMIAAVAVAAIGATASPAYAQVAAEEAVVVSGTSAGTGRASSDLGSAISGSLNSATRTIQSIPRRAPRGTSRRSRGGAVVVGAPLAADSDPLENTNAPAYELSNGATIRVSGGMRNSASAHCRLNCPEDDQETEAAEPVQGEASESKAEATEDTEATRPEAEQAEPD